MGRIDENQGNVLTKIMATAIRSLLWIEDRKENRRRKYRGVEKISGRAMVRENRTVGMGPGFGFLDSSHPNSPRRERTTWRHEHRSRRRGRSSGPFGA
jgi:hypothetical protein